MIKSEQDRTRQFYDEFSQYLQLDTRDDNKRIGYFKQKIAGIVTANNPFNCDILDMGCGIGITSQWMAKLGANVTAVDISPANINYAKEHFAHKNVEYIEADITELRLDRKFSGIVLSDIWEHIPPAYSSFLKNVITRHAKDNGAWIYLNIPDGRYQEAARKHIPERLQMVDEAWTIPGILAQFKSMGFAPVSIDIHGIDCICQYNTFLFRRIADISAAYERTLVKWKAVLK